MRTCKGSTEANDLKTCEQAEVNVLKTKYISMQCVVSYNDAVLGSEECVSKHVSYVETKMKMIHLNDKFEIIFTKTTTTGSTHSVNFASK